VLDRLNGSDFEPAVNLYPADALLAEAADNSARYFYAGALEFLETARKGNRKDARILIVANTGKMYVVTIERSRFIVAMKEDAESLIQMIHLYWWLLRAIFDMDFIEK